MIIDIDKTHPIFESAEYIKDIVPFSLMELIKQTPKILKSNEKNYIVGMIAPQMPTWVWTADDIDSKSLDELKTYFYDYFKDGNKVRFCAKPNIADILSEPFITAFKPEINRIRMESFENKHIIPAKNQAVVIEKPTDNDINSIAEYLSEFEKECFGEYLLPETFIEEAKKKIADGILWVVRDNGSIIAVAGTFRTYSTHTAINGVYTKPEYRCRGYAAALVAHISEYIKSQGKIPSLYTDLSNPSSNKAYINVGFVKCGRVDELNIKW